MSDRALLADRAPLVFAGSPLDRGEAHRRDPARLAERATHPAARAVLLRKGRPAVGPDGALWRGPLAAAEAGAPAAEESSSDPPVYLGEDAAGPLFAVERPPDSPAPEGARWAGARRAAAALPPGEAAIFAQARSLLSWRSTHRFCARCGGPTEQRAGGARRGCTGCGAEHFPRVDPVVIMLAVDGDRCLLGRQAGWPEGLWSALAGFVEPGETLEEACARELHEEAGVRADVAATRYAMCQPWPFPSSLMVGLVAPVRDARIEVDGAELQAARWFDREAVARMAAGTHPEASLPPPLAIARRLAELWAAGRI